MFGGSFILFRDCLERYHWFSSVLFEFIFICMFFSGNGRVVYFVWYMFRDLSMFFRVVILTVSLACLVYDCKLMKAMDHSISSMVIVIISSIRVKAVIIL